MSQVDYATMSDRELKQYFLTHRDDQAAFHAYMDRRRNRPQQEGVDLDDSEWEEKVMAMIRAKMMGDR